MLDNDRQWPKVFGGMLIFSLGVIIFVWFLWWLWRAILALPSTLQTPIVAAIATVLVSVASVIISKRSDRKQEIEQEHRKQKQPIYEQFMDYWFRSLERGKEGADIPETELMEFFSEFTKKLIVWGSDEVLKQYLAFRNFSKTMKKDDTRGLLLAFEKTLYAMRKDLGHKNIGMKSGDLMSLVVTDMDKVLGKSTPLNEQPNRK